MGKAKEQHNWGFQRGVTTLLVSLIVLFVSTLVFFGLNRSTLLELKTANNFYSQSKAQEAARGGVEYGLAWLATSGNSVVAWPASTAAPCAPPVVAGCMPSGNDQIGKVDTNGDNVLEESISTSIGGHSVNVSFWRNSSNPYVIETLAIAVENINAADLSASANSPAYLSRARAAARAKFYVKDGVSFNLSQSPPMITNGCISNVTGNPSINLLPPGQTSGISITSSQVSGCLNTGALDLDGGTVQAGVSMSGSSAWNYLFGTSKAELKALAQGATNNVYYYDSSNPAPNNWHANVGTPTSYGILVFDTGSGCPKINGSPTIYGIVYYADDCGGNQGWGGANIYGVVISEGAITKLTANSVLHESLYTTNSSYYSVSKSVARVIGSWRDY